jgi:protocatechuate 3,4-dioxygenase beta subunit
MSPAADYHLTPLATEMLHAAIGRRVTSKGQLWQESNVIRSFLWPLVAGLTFGFAAGARAQQTATASPYRALPKLPGGIHGPCGSCVAPETLAATTVVPEAGEPGEPLEVSGTVYEPDGSTPAIGVGLFVYHTDARGYYNARMDESDPRIHGWLRTDSAGHYSFRTIRPAPYAHQRMPAHIHENYWSARCPEHWIDDMFFADDTLLPRSLRDSSGQRFTNIVRPRRQGGVWRVERDIRLPRKCGTEP